MPIKDSDVYPVGTVIRIKRTNEFAIIRTHTLTFSHGLATLSGMYSRWLSLEIRVVWLRLRLAWKTFLVWMLTLIVRGSHWIGNSHPDSHL
ncbi:MAG: hypothetical protein C0490_05910 [Marivirga sp.]|nr:hypothetical protein [Marivirga sp.]